MGVYQDTLRKKGQPTHSYRVTNVCLTNQEFKTLVDEHLSYYCRGMHSEYISDAKSLFWISDWKKESLITTLSME